MHNYLHFIRQLNELDLLDFTSEQILCAIAIYNEDNQIPIRCRELLKRSDLGSPATIHKHYRMLIDSKLLRWKTTTADKRVKYIEIAPGGEKYLSRIDQLLIKAANAR